MVASCRVPVSAAVAVSDVDPNSRLGPWRREETGRAVYVDSRNGAPCILKTPRTWQIFEDVKSLTRARLNWICCKDH